MNDTQSHLTEFDEADERTNDSEPSSAESDGTQTTDSVAPASGHKFDGPDPFPAQAITNLTDGTVGLNLYTPDGTVTIDFAYIAGRGGMGGKPQVDSPETVAEVLARLGEGPVLLNGGGMSSPMGSGRVLGRLQDASVDGDTVRVTIDEYYHEQGHAQDRTRSRKLGAYRLAVPETETDYRDAVGALSHWRSGTVDHLNPVEQQKAAVASEQYDTFESLSPGDYVTTPAYASQLEVISHVFETHAIKPRGTLSEQAVPVLAVTVSNPRGGYYQLGLETAPRRQPGATIPTCYMSRSAAAPPTPNTTFTCDERFNSTDLDVTTIDHPPDQRRVGPNRAVIRSPLPEPRLQDPIDSIDGIGETTSRKLSRLTDGPITANSLGHAIYNDGDVHAEAIYDIVDILEQLPRSDHIFEQLQAAAPRKRVRHVSRD